MKNLFEDKSDMPVDHADTRALQRMSMRPVGLSVATAMVPEVGAPYRITSYPASDAMDVHHVSRPRRGHAVD